MCIGIHRVNIDLITSRNSEISLFSSLFFEIVGCMVSVVRVVTKNFNTTAYSALKRCSKRLWVGWRFQPGGRYRLRFH